MQSVASITLITGGPGSGKSTIAQRVAKRFERCLVIEVDQLRGMMRSGLSIPGMGIDDEFSAQFRRARDTAIHMAQVYAKDGIVVLIDDVCVPELFATHYNELLKIPGAKLVLLMPKRRVLRERISQRHRPWDHVLVEKIDWLYDYLEPMPKNGWHVLDTGDWTIDRTVDEVAALICAK